MSTGSLATEMMRTFEGCVKKESFELILHRISPIAVKIFLISHIPIKNKVHFLKV